MDSHTFKYGSPSASRWIRIRTQGGKKRSEGEKSRENIKFCVSKWIKKSCQPFSWQLFGRLNPDPHPLYESGSRKSPIIRIRININYLNRYWLVPGSQRQMRPSPTRGWCHSSGTPAEEEYVGDSRFLKPYSSVMLWPKPKFVKGWTESFSDVFLKYFYCFLFKRRTRNQIRAGKAILLYVSFFNLILDPGEKIAVLRIQMRIVW